jgi:hypothetical protein
VEDVIILLLEKHFISTFFSDPKDNGMAQFLHSTVLLSGTDEDTEKNTIKSV